VSAILEQHYLREALRAAIDKALNDCVEFEDIKRVIAEVLEEFEP
jgi:hypothetical protein